MCYKENRRFKSKRVQHDYMNKWIKNFNKNISCDCKCRFNGEKFNSHQWWNTDKCWCDCKNCHVCEKDYSLNFSRDSCKNTKYWASIMNDSAITCDEITEMDTETKSNDKAKSNDGEAKTIPTNFNEKNIRNFYIFKISSFNPL